MATNRLRLLAASLVLGVMAIAAPATLAADVLVNSNIGFRCPFTQKFVASGVELNAHMSLPVEVKAELNEEMQVSVTLRVPEEIRGEIELATAKVLPYTVVKDCKRITPVEECSNLKKITTGKPITEVNTVQHKEWRTK